MATNTYCSIQHIPTRGFIHFNPNNNSYILGATRQGSALFKPEAATKFLNGPLAESIEQWTIIKEEIPKKSVIYGPQSAEKDIYNAIMNPSD